MNEVVNTENINEIEVIGITEVDGMKFHDIEGGFGECKKAMLVKEIAEIHNKELKHINELINKNRKRFQNDIDIIDLLGVGLNDTKIKKFGFTQQAINSYRGSKNKGLLTGIYLLSERGYAKLLKILEDDKAWEQYEKIVDGYFNMRKSLKENNKFNSSNKPKDIKDESEIKYMNAQARLKNARAREAKIYLELADKVDIKEYKQIMYSKTTELLSGETLIPLPKMERKTYSATEIGKMLGVSANKVGGLANAYNLKTEEYGIKVWDKAKYSDKQVPNFRYYENVIPVLEKALKSFEN
ncbi:TPA: ORF6N domain-containing protein [Clostridioides difficile]|uniref:ORF6N domain-containing protein n=1 Tax=Clostridioides difficile TaxID=1496 RepID=UPI0010335824|nr:ORF6N domain-containing protein [Clostridioides difficile]MDX5782100.1 ORF6N domain-containing protein [Clostridioides difficile]